MKNKTMLVVEDNPDDSELALRALKQNKIANRIGVARGGVEALDYLFGGGAYVGRIPDELPAVVLLDLKLPKLDGLEVLKKIRSTERTRLLPVVILASSKQEQDLVKSYSPGANGFIRKPVDFYQFARSIQELQLYWLVLNESIPSEAYHRENITENTTG